MAILMNEDPLKFNSRHAYKYADSIWARYFDQIFPMAPFTNQTFID